MPVLVGRIVVAEKRPRCDREEGDAGDDLDDSLGQHGTDGHTDRHAHALDQRRSENDARDDRAPRIAGREGEDEELALVAELGDEDGAEGDRRRAKEFCHR